MEAGAMKWLTIGAFQFLGMAAIPVVAQDRCDYETKILASNGSASDSFGTAVAAESGVAVVGAFQAKHEGIDTGAAYVFRFDGTNWNEEQELFASDGASDDFFGRTVAVSGDRIVVGADYDDAPGTNAGSAYLFQYDGSSWQEVVQMMPQDTGPYCYFGRAVGTRG